MSAFFSSKKGVLYTMFMSLLLVGTILFIIGYMYVHSENEAFERLRLETTKQKKSISLQLASDRETLASMAYLIGINYDTTDGYVEVCKGFEPFGLCREIGVLVPGDVLITKHGVTDVSGKLFFEEEKRKGAHIDGRVPDVTNDKRTNIRNAVPITDRNGNTKAVLFGTISAQEFSDYYKNQISIKETYLCLVDGKTGGFIIDTKDIVSEKNISNLANIKYNRGYNYTGLLDGISKGEQGFVSFVANDSDEYLYVCYDTVGIEDWRIMLAYPETLALAGAHKTMAFLVFTSGIICLIILIYILGVVFSGKKTTRMNFVASEIRKNLLEINHRHKSLEDALQMITEYAKSRSAFICDSYGEEFHYIRPDTLGRLNSDDIQYFNEKLLLYSAKHRTTHEATVYSSKIKADQKLKAEMPDFCEFLVVHNIKKVIYNVIVRNSSNTYILGVLNPAHEYVDQLLTKISACFSMSVYNRKHLERTHHMALTDSLTGAKNRMAFKQDTNQNDYSDGNYTCIYIDVNELNYFNNRYGHAAGDQMLKFIGECLLTNFSDSDVYRMGGDEFLILSRIVAEDEIDKRLERIEFDIEEMKYHIAIGVKYSDSKLGLEATVNEAEKIMYQNKSRYYQDKELNKVKSLIANDTYSIDTGVAELDACLSVMSMRYLAVYFVSLEKDTFVKILAPIYFKDVNDKSHLFSEVVKRYIHEFIKPEFHRALSSFIEYDTLKKQLSEQRVPEIIYERIDGEKVILRVYPVNTGNATSDSIWVFEKIV